jgi:hypothetical protein
MPAVGASRSARDDGAAPGNADRERVFTITFRQVGLIFDPLDHDPVGRR